MKKASDGQMGIYVVLKKIEKKLEFFLQNEMIAVSLP